MKHAREKKKCIWCTLKMEGGVKFEVVVMWVTQLLGKCGRVSVHTEEHRWGENHSRQNHSFQEKETLICQCLGLRPAEAQNAMEGKLLPRPSSLLFTQSTGDPLQSR